MSIQLRQPTMDDAEALAELGRTTFQEAFGGLYTPKDEEKFLQEVHSVCAISKELNDPNLEFRVLEQAPGAPDPNQQFQEGSSLQETESAPNHTASPDRELIGYVKIGPLSVPVKPVVKAMELRQLYLRKHYTGCGYGRQLMDWAMLRLAEHGIAECYVSVFSENGRAIAFYERYGFEKCGEYGFRIGQHVDREWIMRRPFA